VSDESREPPSFDRDAPQIEYQDMPTYYASLDIPHVLARVRAVNRFFDEVVDARFRDVYFDLYVAQLKMLEKELRPYALDLALSLVTLENSLRARGKPKSKVKGESDAEDVTEEILSVAIVTPEHGEIFAREWCRISLGVLDLLDAFHATEVMTWPDDPAAQELFRDIEDEIIERVLDAVRPALAEAFVKTANDLFAEKRRRGILKGG
jgi:hypothetical protein